MSKRLEIVTPRLELRLTYLTGLLEPVSEEARMLYAALSHLHEAVPMDTLTFQVSTEEGTYAFRAVSLAGSSWKQGISLPGGADRDPPMTYDIARPWRQSEYAPIAAVRDAMLAVRNRHGLVSLTATWPRVRDA